jgi:hypothetical protein
MNYSGNNVKKEKERKEKKRKEMRDSIGSDSYGDGKSHNQLKLVSSTENQTKNK